MTGKWVARPLLLLLLSLCIVPLAFAQQTGSLSGKVTAVDGSALPGVTVEARSNVLPQPRVTVTNEVGDYRLPALAPGTYTITYSLAGLDTGTRQVRVLLNQEGTVNVALGMAGVSENITVTADTPLTDPTSTAIRSTVSEQMIEQVPVGQEYRDLLKLAPAVAYTEDLIRGPSAGGSGQDNTYMFDGVNVTLPLYGTLSAEPSSHDIAQVSVIKGGAKAVDFNRAAGFTIDSVSKSGTNEWAGELEFQVQNAAFTSDQDFGVNSVYDQDRDWLTFGIGGPVVRDRLFFYGSYYRPTTERANSSNVYGDVPNEESARNEYFGKLTFTPTGNILLHGSYRDSDREVLNTSISGTESPAGSETQTSGLQIAILEGSWIVNSRSFVTFKFNDYANLTSALADVRSGAVPSRTLGTGLDLNNLDALGRFTVPSPRATNAAYNAYIQQFIDRYGYVEGGTRVGGGFVGPAATAVDNIDFFRRSGQLAFDMTLGSAMTHDLHFGFQRFDDAEELVRSSNGWGIIDATSGGTSTCPPAAADCAGRPYFIHAEYLLAGVEGRVLRSEYRSDNFEINDTIRWNDWSFNVGVLLSNDKLYGQGLREADTVSGFEYAPGNRYLMHEVPWKKQIQPRLGVNWAYNGRDTVYTSYARYNPSVSSLPRAASWDRNSLTQLVDVYFDAEGKVIGSNPRAGSTGKLFVDDLDPRYTDEYLIGTSRQLSSNVAARVYARHRYSTNFWEDTNNNARIAFAAPEGIPKEFYIEDLAARLTQIGTGGSQNSYVIAELDGAFTKYWEATVESDYQAGNATFRGTYTWSHYYGNFDQDNTTTVNDASSFVGSSLIGDAAGRQIWDNKYGDLRADRRHLLKGYGYYSLPWNATAGVFGLYQSGHKWEGWSYEPYKHLTSSTSVSNRYAEPAGRRKTDAHYQFDFNYTQSIPIRQLNLQLIADVFNVLDNQTGYNPEPSLLSTNFGNARNHFAPRRFQLAARLQF
jgi:hypothetical protein